MKQGAETVITGTTIRPGIFFFVLRLIFSPVVSIEIPSDGEPPPRVFFPRTFYFQTRLISNIVVHVTSTELFNIFRDLK